MTLPYDVARCAGLGLPQCGDCHRKMQEEKTDQLWFMLPVATEGKCFEQLSLSGNATERIEALIIRGLLYHG